MWPRVPEIIIYVFVQGRSLISPYSPCELGKFLRSHYAERVLKAFFSLMIKVKVK